VSTAVEEAAHEALRARQGSGARYDAATAPATELAWARRGAAYFARLLNELPDDALAAPSLVPGWTRAHVIAHVGYSARALARLVEWARTGVEMSMYESVEARAAEIALGATLPPRALRNLFHHAEVHLNVEWRDLTDVGWDAVVPGRQGAPFPIRETPWARAREIWIHAVDLDNGGSFLDLPPDLLDRLLTELAAEADAGVTLVVSDRRLRIGDGPEVRGTAADLARWLAGRGARRLSGDLPEIVGPRDDG
jgi:maleylpyruvate isomerase